MTVSAAALSVAMFMIGCATIVSGGKQEVALKSKPSNADVVVTNQKGEIVFRGKTPITLTLPTSAGFAQPEDYTVQYSHSGFAPKTVHLGVGVNGWFFANFISWEFPGMIVDMATGAAYKLQSESDVSLGHE